MNKDDEKPGVVIDVTPEAEADDKPEPDPVAEAAQAEAEEAGAGRSPGDNKAPLIIAVVALVLVVGALVLAYRFTQQATSDLASITQRLSDSLEAQEHLREQLDAAKSSVAEQAQRISQQQQQVEQQQQLVEEHKSLVEEQQQTLVDAQERFDAQEQLLNSERLKMTQREAELRASVADVHRRVGSSGTRWMVNEAEYLMRLANHRLSLARDTGTARSALLLADQRLADTGDPGWNPVRDQLAREIVALETAHTPDSAGLSARLQALAEQVPQLRISSSTLGGTTRTLPSQKPEDGPREARSWDTLMDDLWAGFKDTVRIRRNDKPVHAMLAPDQQFFLYENLRLYLETARLGVARNDQQLFRDSLSSVESWLGTYFDPADPLTRSMRKEISGLASTNIRPPLPDITQSLQDLRIRSKLNDDLARTAPRAMPKGAMTDDAVPGDTVSEDAVTDGADKP